MGVSVAVGGIEVAVEVGFGVGVAVAVGVGIGVTVNVGVAVGVIVDMGVAVDVGVSVGVCVGSEVGRVGVLVGTGVAQPTNSAKAMTTAARFFTFLYSFVFDTSAVKSQS